MAIDLAYRQDRKFALDTIANFLQHFAIDFQRTDHTEPVDNILTGDLINWIPEFKISNIHFIK